MDEDLEGPYSGREILKSSFEIQSCVVQAMGNDFVVYKL